MTRNGLRRASPAAPLPPLFAWLSIAAIVDWLITRTVTRAAIHVPKSPVMISGYQATNLVGQVAASLVALLALSAVAWIAWREWQAQRILLPPVLLGHVTLSVAFLVVRPSGWLVLLYNGLVLCAILLLTIRAFTTERSASEEEGKRAVWRGAALLLPALALLAGALYQAMPALYTVMRWPGPPLLAGPLFNVGELLVVASAVGLWWAYGRFASWRLWLAGSLPALLFSLSYQRDPAMTGILAIWSTGLSLYLPWPVYALSLWLAGVTVLTTWSRQPSIAYAVLMLAAAGYAPQLSSQLFCALIALWLLAQPPAQADLAAPAKRRLAFGTGQ